MASAIFIQIVHDELCDICSSLPLKYTKKIAKDISQSLQPILLEEILEGNIINIDDIKLVTEYLFDLLSWPFDNEAEHQILLEKYNINININNKNSYSIFFHYDDWGCPCNEWVNPHKHHILPSYRLDT